MPGAGTSGREIAAKGPTVLNERVVPKTVELNRKLQPAQAPEIVADVKDFDSRVTNVRLRFLHVPLEVPMTNISSTTWRATLSSKDLQKLAVAGETMTYEAEIVARDEKGQVATSKPLTVAIKSPDVVTSTG